MAQSVSIDDEPSNVGAILEALIPFDTLGIGWLYLKQFIDGVTELGDAINRLTNYIECGKHRCCLKLNGNLKSELSKESQLRGLRPESSSQ